MALITIDSFSLFLLAIRYLHISQAICQIALQALSHKRPQLVHPSRSVEEQGYRDPSRI